MSLDRHTRLSSTRHGVQLSTRMRVSESLALHSSCISSDILVWLGLGCVGVLMCSWNVTAPRSLPLKQTHAHGDHRTVTWIPLTGLYSLFFPVRGQEPESGLSQPMTKALPWPLLLPSCPGAPTPRAPDNLFHPGG